MKNYIQTILCSSALVLALLAILNFFLDPLLLYPHDWFKPIEAKRQLINYARAHKTAQIEYLEPELLILGSSRAFDGIGLNHPYLNQEFRQSYNAALYNGTVHEMLALFNHALCQKNLKTVVIGLDFFVFNAQRPTFQKGGGAEFLQSESCLSTRVKLAKSLFNFSNLRLDKLFNDRKMSITLDVLQDGSLAVESSAEQRKIPLAASLSSEKNYIKMDGFYKDYVFSNQNLEALERLIATAVEHGIEVKIFISPSHVRRWEVLDYAIGIKEFELFKTKLTQLVSQYSHKHQVQLWDFAVYHEYTTEAVTEKPMKWHWESSHYKKELGVEIINRIFGQSSLTEKTQNFGLMLSLENLDDHLLNQKHAREDWLKMHPTEIAQLMENLNSAR